MFIYEEVLIIRLIHTAPPTFVKIYATTAMLCLENPDTWNRHESIESTVKHKPRRQGSRNIET